MASGQTVRRVVVPTALTAVLTTGLAAAVEYATEGGSSPWAWVTVAVLTAAVFAVSLWRELSQPADTSPSGGAAASGNRSVAVRGNPSGPISTGDVGVPAYSAPSAGPATSAPGPGVPLQGGASASGERSVAISGDSGAEISTGDRHSPPAAP